MARKLIVSILVMASIIIVLLLMRVIGTRLDPD